jgi:hypothetical protein
MKPLINTVRFNYRQARAQYELGSKEFRLKVELAMIGAGAIGVALTFYAGWAFGGYMSA